MAEVVYRRPAPPVEEHSERPWAAVVVVVVVVAAFVAGCRAGRGWGRLMGY